MFNQNNQHVYQFCMLLVRNIEHLVNLISLNTMLFMPGKNNTLHAYWLQNDFH